MENINGVRSLEHITRQLRANELNAIILENRLMAYYIECATKKDGGFNIAAEIRGSMVLGQETSIHQIQDCILVNTDLTVPTSRISMELWQMSASGMVKQVRRAVWIKLMQDEP